MSAQADELVSQFWPEHVQCRETTGNGAESFEDEGVVCTGCGAVLGWPEETVTNPSDDTDGMSHGTYVRTVADGERHAQESGLTHPDLAETANDPDGGLFDQQGPQPDNRDAWMRERFERNSFDAEARAYVNGQTDLTAPDEQPPEPSYVTPDDPPWDTSREVGGVVAPVQDNAGDLVPYRSTELDTPVQPSDPINAALAAIDPTQVYTPTDIEMQLVDLERRLEQGQVFQRVWENRAYEAGVAYELAWAKALVSADGSSDSVRKAQALLECREEYVAKATADHMVKAVRETMHNLRSMLSGYQSIARSIGSSWSVAGADLNREQLPARR